MAEGGAVRVDRSDPAGFAGCLRKRGGGLAKRRYPKHFITKLSNADAEAAEVQCWLEFATACGYLSAEAAERLAWQYHRITAGLVKMMTATDKWCGPANLARDPDVPYSPN